MKFTKKSKKRNNKNKTRKKRGGAVPIMYDISAREMPNPIPLMCPICKNQTFFLKDSMLRGGRIASFFELEWLFDKSAKIAICSKCSHMTWFKDKGAIIPH